MPPLRLEEVSSKVYPGLDRKAGDSNWVDKAGGLPSYIERIAKHLHYEKGKSIGTAIAIAVNTVKKWATGFNHNGSKVSAKTQATAAKAVAEWEAKKAKSHVTEAEESVELTPAEELELHEAFSRKLTLTEGFLMTLKDKAAGKKAKRHATASAVQLLEGKRRLDWNDQNEDFNDTKARLQAEATASRFIVEGSFTGAREFKVKAKARGGGNARDPEFEKKHPRAAKGRVGGGQWIMGAQRELGFTGKDLTGKLDAKTKAAVRAFQQEHDLQVDGIIGAQTAGLMQDQTGIAPAPLTAADKKFLAGRAKDKAYTKTRRKAGTLAESKLTAKARNAISDSNFALPGRRYPIHDISHARNALARASGKPEEGKVRAAVYAKYPQLKKGKNVTEAAHETTEPILLSETLEITRSARAWAAENAPQAFIAMRCLEESIVSMVRANPDAKWDPRLHPRNRLARFVDVPDYLEVDYRQRSLNSPGTVPDAQRKMARGYGVGYGNRYVRPKGKPKEARTPKDVARAFGIEPAAQSTMDSGPGRRGAMRSPGVPGYATRGAGTDARPRHTVAYSPEKKQWAHMVKTPGSVQRTFHQTEAEARRAAGMKGGRKEAGPPPNFKTNITGKIPAPASPARKEMGKASPGGGQIPRMDIAGPKAGSDEQRKLARGYGVGYGSRYERPKTKPKGDAKKDAKSAYGIDDAGGPTQSPGQLGALRSPGWTESSSGTPHWRELPGESPESSGQTERSAPRPTTAESDTLRQDGVLPGNAKNVKIGELAGGMIGVSWDTPSGGRRQTLAAQNPSGVWEDVGPEGMQSPGIEGDIKDKSISELAAMVRRDWGKVNYAAVPYLDAMDSLDSIDDRFGMDSGKSVVAYFLSNATSWRGETARAVKAELKRRMKASKTGFLSPGIQSDRERQIARGYGVGYGNRFANPRSAPKKDMASAYGVDAAGGPTQSPGQLGALRSPALTPSPRKGTPVIADESTRMSPDRMRQIVDAPGTPPGLRREIADELRKARVNSGTSETHGVRGMRSGTISDRDRQLARGYGVGYARPSLHDLMPGPDEKEDRATGKPAEPKRSLADVYGVDPSGGPTQSPGELGRLASPGIPTGLDDPEYQRRKAESGAQERRRADREALNDLRRQYEGLMKQGRTEEAHRVLARHDALMAQLPGAGIYGPDYEPGMRSPGIPSAYEGVGGYDASVGKMSTEQLQQILRNPNADPALRANAAQELQNRRRGGSPLGAPPVVS